MRLEMPLMVRLRVAQKRGGNMIIEWNKDLCRERLSHNNIFTFDYKENIS